MKEARPDRCWCGNEHLEYFGRGYWRCGSCETLVYPPPPHGTVAAVTADEQGFYGRDYWLSYQPTVHNHPSVISRARTDLSERCLWWLRALLRYQVPPARVLELGCAHGGFVALLRQAGFDATGLELSPWMAAFARETFHVPVLEGPIEAQRLEAGSLEAIALMDVLEHFQSPVLSMEHCLELLSGNGVFLMQTPRYPEGAMLDGLEAANDPFLQQLKPVEHLFLFSRSSIREFFARLGARVVFEPAIFAHYDMFLVAGKGAVEPLASDAVAASLDRTPGGRLVQSMLDLYQRSADREGALARERAELATQLELLSKALDDLRAERNALREYLASAQRDLERAADRETAQEERIRALQDVIAVGDRTVAERATQILHASLHLDRLDARMKVLQSQAGDMAARLGQASAIVERIRQSRAFRMLSLAGPGAGLDRQLEEIFPSTTTSTHALRRDQAQSRLDSPRSPGATIAADSSSAKGDTGSSRGMAGADETFRERIQGLLPDGWTEQLVVVTYGRSEEPRTLEVTFEAPSWGIGPSMLVSVEGSGVPPAWFDIRRGAQRAISVQLPQSGGYLEFAVSPLSQPKAFGMGDDERFIGCRLIDWRVSPR